MFKIFCFIVALLPIGSIAKSTFLDNLSSRIERKYSGNTYIFSKKTAVGDTGITSKLKNYAKQHLIEKAYLHFDKPYYAAGDTIYFKGYLIMGQKHLLSTLSGVLYVDLINTENKVDQSIRLQVINGVAWGDFALADSLPKGNYRVRAYTRWMRNDGDRAYFYQTIPVGSVTNKYIAAKQTVNTVTTNNKADIQFFPESGELVAGIKSKVTFKAIAANGLGIDVKGIIIDSENKEIISFKAEHLGMGYFYLSPQKDKTYLAKLTYTDGTQNTVKLPNVEEKGITLTINNDSLSKASIRIETNEAYFQENKDKKYTLLVYSGGVATTVNCQLDSPLIQLDVLKRRLQTGIARVTLFSQENDPLCERLFFVQNYNQLSLSVSTEKVSYTPREKVIMNLNVKDRADSAAKGHFSVSVTDETKVPVDENSENTILTNLLLTSDLEGYVEQPNYYFIDINDKTEADLDLVMLTHGYRRFQWKQLLENTYPNVVYQPEINLEISGVVKNLLGRPLKKATVSLIAKQNGQFTTTLTDINGKFIFDNLVFSDTGKFVLQAINSKGKSNTELFYAPDKPEPVLEITNYFLQTNTSPQFMAAYLNNSQKQQYNDAKYGVIKGRLLKEVVIKANKPDESNFYNNLGSEQFADQVIHANQMAKGGPFSGRIEGLLRGIHIERRGSEAYAVSNGGIGKGRLTVVLDGGPTDGDLDKIAGLDIESVEIFKFSSPNATLVINTKKNKGLQSEDIASIGILPISPKGYYKAREFYTPKYDHQAENNKRADLRSTIYWKPDLVTDNQGNVNFEFYNADGTGSYKITIEGIDKNGNLGRQVYRYSVEQSPK